MTPKKKRLLTQAAIEELAKKDDLVAAIMAARRVTLSAALDEVERAIDSAAGNQIEAKAKQ
jgi:hypothetical protein